MRQELANIYSYKVNVKSKLKKVKVLKVIDGVEPSLVVSQNSKTSAISGGKGLTMTNSGIKEVAKFLEMAFQIPVVDETYLKDTYDLQLAWFNENPRAIHTALRNIGLELVDGERMIEMLVISD